MGTTHTSAAAGAPPRVRIARRLLEVVAWLFVAVLLVEVYLAGLFMMGGENVRDLHVALGYSVGSVAPLTMLVLGLLARMAVRIWGVLPAVMFVLLHVQPVSTNVSPDRYSWVRALHAPAGVLLIGLACWQALMIRAYLGRHPSE